MKGNNKKSRKGFTLIELLVVIAIIAILSVVVILTLNPAELLRQSRDSNRISDLSVAKSGMAFYLASVTSPAIGSSTFCYVDVSGLTNGTTTCTWFLTATSSIVSTTAANTLKIDGTGWIPVNLSGITAGGSPLGQLPHDPLDNDKIHMYTYAASSTGLVFKFGAKLESLKYSNGGSGDVASTDGGNDVNTYEQGTSLSL